MSSASTGRYQSRLLNFLLDKSQQLSDLVGQAARQVKTTTIWSLQLLIYPMYAMFQTGRLAGQQMQQAAGEKFRRLQGSSKKRSPVRQKTSKQQKAINLEWDLPLPPLTEKADDSPLVAAFRKPIRWMETGSVAVKVNLFKESKLVEPPVPPTASRSGESDMEKMATVSPGIEAQKTEDLSFLTAVDRVVAQLEEGQLPDWQEIGNDVVVGTRSLWQPVKNWYMWQGDEFLELQDDELTRDLWAESSPQSPVKSPASPAKSQKLIPQLPGKVLPQLVQKSEAVVRVTITEWFGKVSALVHPATVNSSVVEITPPTPAISVKPAAEPEANVSNVSYELEQQTFSLFTELPEVREPNHSLVYQGWDLLRSKALTIKEILAISTVAKSSQSLATAATAESTIQKVGQTVAPTVGQSPVASDLVTPTNDATGTISKTETTSSDMGEPETGRDYIETKAVSVGYIKHPLQVVLEGIDRAMLWLEKMAMGLFEWWKKLKQEFMV